MSRKSLLLAFPLLFSALYVSASDQTDSVVADTVAVSLPMQPDTLLNVKSASHIDIDSWNSSTTITVKRLDDTEDNFYYETRTAKKSSGFSHLQISKGDIKDITVIESDKDVKVSYVDSKGNRENYDFLFSDPENRSQKSYVGPKWSDFAISLSDNRSVKWQAVTRGLSVGWVTPTKPAPDFNASMGRSVEISWLMVLGIEMKYRAFSVATGLGIDWRNFVTKGDRFFHRNDDGRISLEPYDVEMSDRRSRIKVFSLQLPVLFSLRLGNGGKWGLSAGPVVNFNTSASIKTQYKIGNESYSIKTGNIGQRPVTVDAYFAFTYDGLGVYARYSPMNMMKNSTSLDFGAFSTGLTIMF